MDTSVVVVAITGTVNWKDSITDLLESVSGLFIQIRRWDTYWPGSRVTATLSWFLCALAMLAKSKQEDMTVHRLRLATTPWSTPR